MSLSLIMLGDIVGQPGRNVIAQQLSELRKSCSADCVIANAENSAAGSGLTPAIADELFAAGIDGLTLGDHVYRRGEIIPRLRKDGRIARPANLSTDAPGPQWIELPTPAGVKLVVVTVLGRVLMPTLKADDPFAAVDRVLGLVPEGSVVVVEIHAETTGEKVALGHYLDGRVAAVVGTHTHIPTADAKVLPGGTAYISDLGMTGPYDSVLGRLKDRVVKFMTTGVPTKFDVAEGDVRMCGVHIVVDDSGKASSCQRVEVRADHKAKPFVLSTGDER